MNTLLGPSQIWPWKSFVSSLMFQLFLFLRNILFTLFSINSKSLDSLTPVLAQSVLYVGLAASTGFYLMTWTEKNSLDSLPVRSDFHNTDQMNSQSPQGRQIRVNRDTCKIGSKVLLSEAAAALLQSCPTLCDTIDGSPPGSPGPGIRQARTLEWVAISFSHA